MLTSQVRLDEQMIKAANNLEELNVWVDPTLHEDTGTKRNVERPVLGQRVARYSTDGLLRCLVQSSA